MLRQKCYVKISRLSDIWKIPVLMRLSKHNLAVWDRSFIFFLLSFFFKLYHRSGDAPSRHFRLRLGWPSIWILWHSNLRNISGHEWRRRLHRLQNGWVCHTMGPQKKRLHHTTSKTRLLLNPCDWSCCVCIKEKTVVSSVSKWVHCWHHLPPQAMKAASWMVYQNQQKASSQPPARQNEATSSSGRSRPPMNEKTSKKTKIRLSCRHQSRPPTPACPQVFHLILLIALNAWIVDYFVKENYF